MTRAVFLFALPLLIVTLGLFILVINALLLYVVGSILKSFHVASFGAAFFGALVISLVSMVANWMLGTGEARVTVGRSSSRVDRPDRPQRPPPPEGPGGSGPIIDV